MQTSSFCGPCFLPELYKVSTSKPAKTAVLEEAPCSDGESKLWVFVYFSFRRYKLTLSPNALHLDVDPHTVCRYPVTASLVSPSARPWSSSLEVLALSQFLQLILRLKRLQGWLILHILLLWTVPWKPAPCSCSCTSSLPPLLDSLSFPSLSHPSPTQLTSHR